MQRDFEDTATEYSNTSSTTASREKRYTQVLAKDLFSKVGLKDTDLKTQSTAAAALPALLKAFALKVGHYAPTQMH